VCSIILPRLCVALLLDWVKSGKRRKTTDFVRFSHSAFRFSLNGPIRVSITTIVEIQVNYFLTAP
jgi:hypothetical protein